MDVPAGLGRTSGAAEDSGSDHPPVQV